MSISSLVKNIQDIMRRDPGVDGDAQRISQMVWMIFLKVYDAKESYWELYEEDYKSIIPANLRWRNWAEDDEGITGDELLNFINNELFEGLKDLEVDEYTERKSLIVKLVFEDSFNYMKNGTLIRQVINKLNEINFEDYDDIHAFNDIYETILKDLQSAGNAGEYYTPRVLTNFIIEALDPKINERVGDLAAGTGGFLVSTINHLENQIDSVADKESLEKNIYGVEKKPMPHLLGITNLLLNDIDNPRIIRGNSLADNIRDYKLEDKFDVIAMNPPFGGVEEDGILGNFPTSYRTSETADLFMTVIMNRLKNNGRAGVVLPDGFLFGDDRAKTEIKKDLLEGYNLHTIVRLPAGIFSPYTSIATNILFFENNSETKEIDYYEVLLPDGYKSFSKTKPMTERHIKELKEWYFNRDIETERAYKVTIDEVEERNYNLDIKNKNIVDEVEQYSLEELLGKLNSNILEISSIYEQLDSELDGTEE